MASNQLRRSLWLLALLATAAALAMASGLAAAGSLTGKRSPRVSVPGFDLLRKPTTLTALPRPERVQIRRTLRSRPVRGLRMGEVSFAAGKVRAVGNGVVVCLFSRLESYGAGACGSRRAAVRRGINFVSFCAGASHDGARITGIAPNRVAGVRLRSTSDVSLLSRASMVSNVFTMIAPPIDATLTWVGAGSGAAVRLPLARLASESECSFRSGEP